MYNLTKSPQHQCIPLVTKMPPPSHSLHKSTIFQYLLYASTGTREPGINFCQDQTPTKIASNPVWKSWPVLNYKETKGLASSVVHSHEVGRESFSRELRLWGKISVIWLAIPLAQDGKILGTGMANTMAIDLERMWKWPTSQSQNIGLKEKIIYLACLHREDWHARVCRTMAPIHTSFHFAVSFPPVCLLYWVVKTRKTMSLSSLSSKSTKVRNPKDSFYLGSSLGLWGFPVPPCCLVTWAVEGWKLAWTWAAHAVLISETKCTWKVRLPIVSKNTTKMCWSFLTILWLPKLGRDSGYHIDHTLCFQG